MSVPSDFGEVADKRGADSAQESGALVSHLITTGNITEVKSSMCGAAGGHFPAALSKGSLSWDKSARLLHKKYYQLRRTG